MAEERSYLKQFTDLGLAEAILRAVSAEGYTTPTPIQADVIPAMLAGHDVLGTAQTGTGKTAAFVLPLLNQIAARGTPPRPKTATALIMSPTRELASQIADNIRIYGQFMRVSVALVVGGARAMPQIRALSRGVDIIVATPGRLLDHASSGAVRLDHTNIVVLDEADHMLDLGFMPAIREILQMVAKPRQTVMLSATMPKQIRNLAREFQKDPVQISAGSDSPAISRIAQSVVQTDNASKRHVLTTLLSAPEVGRAIVFTRTKRCADTVHLHLQNAGLSAGAIHGDKSQGERSNALASFKAGRTSILVATDIAARGIDVDDISHVFNYELPDAAEAYVHRIGRTARAGRSGIAISLCAPSERNLLRGIERLIGTPLERHAGSFGQSPAYEEPRRIARR